jgi:ankyrin repeat protein
MSKKPTQTDIDEFVKAARRGQASYVAGLLKRGMPVDAIDEHGTTALYAAASKGATETIMVLVGADAQINLEMPRKVASPKSNASPFDNWARTALNAATKAAHADAVDLLLDLGADPRIVDGSNNTAAHHLLAETDIWLRQPNGAERAESVLTRVLRYGVRINQVNSSGESLLMLAAKHRAPLQLLDTLYAQGADVHRRNSNWQTALHYAAQGLNVPALHWLAERGAHVNAQTIDGRTALFSIPSPDVFDALVALGIDLDRKDIFGRTALNQRLQEHPANTAPSEIVKMLIGAGASLDIVDDTGASPRSVIKVRRMAELKPLVAAQAARAAMHRAVGRSTDSPLPSQRRIGAS